MPDQADRLSPPPRLPPREPMTTDRKIALAGIVVAAIGAVAALAVVPEFRCLVLHDGCSTSSTAATAAAVPAILGLTGFIAYSLLRRTKGNDQITLRIIDKIRSNAPDLYADRLANMNPSALGKAIAVNGRLRSQVGEHDFQLLQAVIRNQFVTSLVVYGLCVFCFVIGVILYFLLQPPPIVGQQLIFRADDGGQAVVTGTAEVVYHGDSRSASFTDATNITIAGIPSSEIGKPFTLLVRSDDYEPPTGPADQFTFSKDPIFVPLKLKPFDPYAGAVFLDGNPVIGATVSLYGLPCQTKTGDSGYFEFRDCPQSRRLQAAKLVVTLPSVGSPCANRFPLLPRSKLTAINVNADCSQFDTAIMACPSCKPDFVDPDKKPSFDVCRRDIKGELWTRLIPARWRQRDGCAVRCHIRVSDRMVYVQAGSLPQFRIQFGSPDTCGSIEFELDADQLFSDR
jgi:hypothetical protein